MATGKISPYFVTKENFRLMAVCSSYAMKEAPLESLAMEPRNEAALAELTTLWKAGLRDDLVKYWRGGMPEDDACMLVDEAWQEVVGKFAAGEKPIKSVKAVIVFYAKNRAYDYFKAKKRHKLKLAELAQTDTSKSNPSEAAENVELTKKLQEAILGLPEKYQQIITLSYIREIPLREIAERLRIKEDRARYLKKCAFLELKRTLLSTLT